MDVYANTDRHAGAHLDAKPDLYTAPHWNTPAYFHLDEHQLADADHYAHANADGDLDTHRYANAYHYAHAHTDTALANAGLSLPGSDTDAAVARCRYFGGAAPG